jgi:hypothetical protein
VTFVIFFVDGRVEEALFDDDICIPVVLVDLVLIIAFV